MKFGPSRNEVCHGESKQASRYTSSTSTCAPMLRMVGEIARSMGAHDFSHHAQLGINRAHPARIVQVGDHDQPRARRNAAFHLARIQLKSRFEFAREAPDLRAQ